MRGAKFLFKCFLFYIAYLILIRVFTFDILAPAQQTLFYQNEFLAEAQYQTPPKSLILGDSTAVFAYTAPRLPATQSLAVFSGSFTELYETLIRYLDKLPPPKCLILSASYNWNYHRDGKFWDIYVFNRYYSLTQLDQIYEASREFNGFPAAEFSKVRFFWEVFLYESRLKGVHLTDIQDALTKRIAANANRRFYFALRKMAGTINKMERIFPFFWAPHEQLRKSFQPDAAYDAYLKKLLELAAQKNIQVHWLQPPVAKSILTPEVLSFYADLNRHVEPIVLSYARNTYTGTPAPYDDELMFSATHANSNGAHQFTEQVRPVFEQCEKL